MIRQRINDGVYSLGSQLPTELELVEEFSASRMTVSKGLSELIEAGLPANRRHADPRYTAQEIQLAQVEDMLEKCRISSPVQGIVIEKYAQRGEQAYAGRPLLKIADIDNMYLKAYVTATQLASLQLGQEVKVFSRRDGKDVEYPGRISHISDQAEFTPKSIQTQDERDNLVYAVKIRVKNDGYLKMGMYANVNF